MNRTKIKEHLEKMIAEAANKGMWLGNKGQGIMLSPLSLKKNIDAGKYLITEGWSYMPIESIKKMLESDVKTAQETLSNFITDPEESIKHFINGTTDQAS